MYDLGKIMGENITFTGTGKFMGTGQATGKMKVFGENFVCTGSGAFYVSKNVKLVLLMKFMGICSDC